MLVLACLLLSSAFVLFTFVVCQSAPGPMGGQFVFGDALFSCVLIQVGLVIVGNQKSWLAWLHLFDFNTQSAFGSNVCVAPLSPYDLMGASLLLPLLFFVELAFGMVIHCGVSMSQPHERVAIPVRFVEILALICGSVSVQLHAVRDVLLPVFGECCLESLLLILCVQSCEDIAGVSVVAQHPGVNCDDSRYKLWLVLLISVLVLNVLLGPIALTMFLFFHRGKLSISTDRSNDHSAALTFPGAFGVVFHPFSTHSQLIAVFWPALVLFRRMLFSAIATIRAPQFDSWRLASAAVYS